MLPLALLRPFCLDGLHASDYIDDNAITPTLCFWAYATAYRSQLIHPSTVPSLSGLSNVAVDAFHDHVVLVGACNRLHADRVVKLQPLISIAIKL